MSEVKVVHMESVLLRYDLVVQFSRLVVIIYDGTCLLSLSFCL